MNISIAIRTIVLMSAGALSPWTGREAQGGGFAGWIRYSDCPVVVRNADGTSHPLSVAQAKSHQLFVGQSLISKGPGNATLLIYGHQKKLAPSLWYPIPGDKSQAPDGEDIYGMYTARGGMSRGEPPSPQNIWRAVSLSDLEGKSQEGDLRINIRLVHQNGDVANDEKGSNMLSFRPGEKATLLVENVSEMPVHLQVLDIDFAANVVILPTQNASHDFALPPRSGWQRFPCKISMSVPAGYSGGIEHFRAIASDRPIDLSALETKNAAMPEETETDSGDPLFNLILAAGGHLDASTWPNWSVAGLEFRVDLP